MTQSDKPGVQTPHERFADYGPYGPDPEDKHDSDQSDDTDGPERRQATLWEAVTEQKSLRDY